MDNYIKRYAARYKEMFDTPYNVPTKNSHPEGCDGLNIQSIKAHLNQTIQDLKSMLSNGAWFFGAACSFLDVLTWAAYFTTINAREELSRRTSGKDYQNFLKNYFFQANTHYATCYNKLTNSNDENFAKRMYKTLRCGVLHSFSMKQSMETTVFDYTILLARHEDFNDTKNHHLEIVKLFMDDDENYREAVILIAQKFMQDIEDCVTRMLNLATPDSQLEKNFIELYKHKPPLGFLDIDK